MNYGKQKMLKIENLHATVADKPILKGLSLAINAGEIHAIMGPNGAGKSTLSYVLGGRLGYEVTEGSVMFAPSPCHPRESGDPGETLSDATLGPRSRGDDSSAERRVGQVSFRRYRSRRSQSQHNKNTKKHQ